MRPWLSRKECRIERAALLSLALVVLGAPSCPTRPALPVGRDPEQARALAQLRDFTDWLARNDAGGYIGEVGWPDNSGGDAPKWNALAAAWYSQADAAELWVTAWSTGEWWGTAYKLADYEDVHPE